MRPIAQGLWPLLQPALYTHGLRPRARLPGGYAWFLDQRRRYTAAGGQAPFHLLNPRLTDRGSGSQSGGGHYFYQDVWALRRLADFSPAEPHDVGSRYDGFVGQAMAICPVTSWEFRPPSFTLANLRFRQGNILSLHLTDGSVSSLSCLHVADHIGLGRYGDPLDPEGTDKALRELARVLAPGGQLLFSVPVGRERTEFNAQRVLDPRRLPSLVPGLRLAEFSVVDDADTFVEHASPDRYADATYACGLYRFARDPA